MESSGSTAEANIGITKNPDINTETSGPTRKPDRQQVTKLGTTGSSGGSDERYEGEDGERRGGRYKNSPPLDNSGLAREIENNRVPLNLHRAA